MKAHDTYKGKTLIEWSRILAADFAAELRRMDKAGESGSISLKEAIDRDDASAANDFCDANQLCIDVMEAHQIELVFDIEDLPEDEQAAAEIEQGIQIVLSDVMQEIASDCRYKVRDIKKQSDDVVAEYLDKRIQLHNKCMAMHKRG